jgi:voltage-gated sodium channel
MLVRACRRTADSAVFQNVIISVIALAAILVGIETFDEFAAEHHELFVALDRVLLAIFTAEIAIRIIAYGSRPWDFLKDPWNVFDFATVAIFYLPFVGSHVAILRLARIIRMMRLIRAVPGLRLLVVALIHSLPSIGYIGLLLLGQVYVYAIVGNLLFGPSDPYFDNVAVAMQTLLQVVTFDDWAAIMRAQDNQVVSTIYFVTFILTGTMIILNLFIGVVMDGFSVARAQFAAEEREAIVAAVAQEANDVEDELERIHQQLTTLTNDVHRLLGTSQRLRSNVAAPLSTGEAVGDAVLRS